VSRIANEAIAKKIANAFSQQREEFHNTSTKAPFIFSTFPFSGERFGVQLNGSSMSIDN
jgi:hypothetical protein